MDRLLLVDGSNLLFQMFYGMPGRITAPDGRPIQGTLGFIGALLRMLRMVRPTHAAVFFDGECENSRTALDPDYKTNREDYSVLPEEETPFSQLPDICRALELLAIPCAETVDCETDDWIAAYALHRGDMELVIASFDSDYFQLIDEKTQVLRYRGEKSCFWDEAYLKEKLGIDARLYADFKSLTGDQSDNLRGAYKVGPKTAAALLAQFGSLEGILAGGDAISRPGIREAIREAAPRLRLNYRLIKLTGDTPLPIPVESLRCAIPTLTTTQVLTALGLK